MSTEEEQAFMRALGKRLRILRLTAELTQDQLADAASISRSFISSDRARLARH